jgi:putative endonuclease
MTFSVYILSNFARTVFYIGVTNDLINRIFQHRNSESTFTAKYKCHYLMYYEDFSDVRNAITREKQLKNWKREWKIDLIRKDNPNLLDLAEAWIEKDPGSDPG